MFCLQSSWQLTCIKECPAPNNSLFRVWHFLLLFSITGLHVHLKQLVSNGQKNFLCPPPWKKFKWKTLLGLHWFDIKFYIMYIFEDDCSQCTDTCPKCPSRTKYEWFVYTFHSVLKTTELSSKVQSLCVSSRCIWAMNDAGPAHISTATVLQTTRIQVQNQP